VTPAEAGTPRRTPVQPAALWGAALVTAVVAGAAAWVSGERTRDYYEPSLEARQAAAARQYTKYRQETEANEPKNAALVFGVLGAAVGLTLGLVGGLVRRSIIAGAAAGLAGTLLGAAAGILIPFALARTFQRNFDPAAPSLLLPLLIHVGLWAPIGAAGGLALGLALGGPARIVRCTTGGLVGAAIGAVAFELTQALCYAEIRVLGIIPDEATALLAYLAVALGAAAGAAAMAPDAAAKRGRTASATVPLA
jgi:hypothetical protein